MLKGIVEDTVKRYANAFLEGKRLFDRAKEQETGSFSEVSAYDRELRRLKAEQDRYYSLCAGLYDDLRQGIVTKEEFERLHAGFEKKAIELGEAQKKQEALIRDMFKKGVLSAGRLKAFQDCVELKEIDRHTLSSLVKRIYVYEGKRIEIEYYFIDQYEVMLGIGVRQAEHEVAGASGRNDAERGA